MSKIIATDSIEVGDWMVNFENLRPDYADLFIGFKNNLQTVVFQNLKFKFELRQGDNIKKYGVYPPPYVRYVQSDQSYLVSERLFFDPSTEYELYLWAENGGVSFEHTETFTTPVSEGEA